MLRDKSQRKQILYDFIYTCTLKKTKQMNKHNKAESQIQRTNRWLPEGKVVGGGEKQVRATKRYKPPAAKQMSHRYEVYSVGNRVSNYEYLSCSSSYRW